MLILESSIRPFEPHGIPILNHELMIYQQLVVIDWELKRWRNPNSIMTDTLFKKVLRGVAKRHGARVVHVYSTKGYLIVHYRVNKTWGSTRLPV